MRIAVVGSGVSGLTCADELADHAEVTVLYADAAHETTSALATAMWHVFLVDPGDTRVLRWASRTMHRMLTICELEPVSGIGRVTGVELYREPIDIPRWSSIPPSFRMLSPMELAQYPGVSAAFKVETVLADMLTYLPWLKDRAARKGVRFERRRLNTLDAVAPDYDLIVNCSGLQARELVSDNSVRPVKGQYLILPRLPETPSEYVGDDENPAGMAYVVPRRNDVLVGGTEEFDISNLEFTEDPREMLQRSSVNAPWLANYTTESVLSKVVCHRPFRTLGVRLEMANLDDGRPVIHNYGHGGSGFSLSWGCAEDVAALALSRPMQ